MVFDGHIMLTPVNDALEVCGYRSYRCKGQANYSLWPNFLHPELYVPYRLFVV